MNGAPIFVWSGANCGGLFSNLSAAVQHCKLCSNDHRRNVELQTFVSGATRYVGPRGRRHGIRLVAYLGTRDQLGFLGIDVDALSKNLEQTG